MDFSFLLPSRNRRDMLDRLVSSIRESATDPDCYEILIYADNDDAETVAYCESSGAACIVGGRDSMGSYLTQLCDRASGDYVILINDDVIVRTQGWDKLILDAVSAPDKAVLAYPNDLFKGPRLCTFPILSREAFTIIADHSLAEYKGACIDLHLLDIFMRLRLKGKGVIRYLPDVVFEHLHHRAGKSTYDETYADRDRFGDDETFLRLALQRRNAAKALSNGKASSGPATDRAQAIPDNGTPPGPARFRPWRNASMLLGAVGMDKALPLAWRLRMMRFFAFRWGYRCLTGSLRLLRPRRG